MTKCTAVATENENSIDSAVLSGHYSRNSHRTHRFLLLAIRALRFAPGRDALVVRLQENGGVGAWHKEDDDVSASELEVRQ